MDVSKALLSVFDDESSIYVLHIIPTSAFGYGVTWPNQIERYSGIHIVDTASLLSIHADPQEHVIISLNQYGEQVDQYSEDIVISLESIEIGEWCRAILDQGDLQMLEHTDIPHIVKRDDFTIFEQLAKASFSQLSLAWCYAMVDKSRHNIHTTRSPHIAFDSYHTLLQGITFASIQKIIHEADELVAIEQDHTKMYPTVIQRITEQQPLTRRECSQVSFEITRLLGVLEECTEDTALPEEPSEETIQKIDKELLRLRRALL